MYKPNLRMKVKILENFDSQWKFAHDVGAHESLVSAVVRGRREINEKQQKKWAKALKCKPKDIF